MQPVELRLSRTARCATVTYPYVLGWILLISVGGVLLGTLANGAGGAGAAIGFVAGAAFLGYGRRRMKATYLVISDEDATVGNGSSHATTIAWPDVKRIERAWNPVGILAPRGFVLRIASRSSAASDSLVYASYLAARSDREAVYDAIVALSARYGFELAPDFGTGTSFLKVGRDRES